MAIFRGAQQLGLHPYEFGGFLSLESGPNMDPNIVGGAGGRHRGLIQFGQNEQKLYGISGPQTRAGQMPAVLKYFEDRGFKPGMGIGRAYATVLGGNPNVSLDSKDSFGTSVRSALPRFKEGGDLFKNAQRVLGDIPEGYGTLPSTGQASQGQQQQDVSSNGFLQGFLKAMTGSNVKELSTKEIIKQQLMSQLLAPQSPMGSLDFLSAYLNPFT
jgi:hypothetical protein